MRILVTGATGYIGGRLAPRLLDRGHHVRVMTRDPVRLRDIPWAVRAEVVRADARDPESLRSALDGIEVAYYLIHSIDSGGDFSAVDRRAANAFAAAARAADVRRIVYLGGLGPATTGGTSAHLSSRQEVGRILLGSGVPTIVLRAAVVIGSGSASFEMLRYLTERLPVMLTPRWVRTRIQPIAVRDVLHYLIGALDVPDEVEGTFDVGGPDILTYAEMMQRFAAIEGLRRRIIVPVPILSPELSSLWVGLVTPVPGGIARPLIRSLRNEVVVHDHQVARWIPDPAEGLLPFDAAVALALARVRARSVKTRWSTAVWPGSGGASDDGDGAGATHPPNEPLPTDPQWAGGSLYVDERSMAVAAPPACLWHVIEGIGGDNGWYSWPLAWSARGWLDTALGGVGLRRGRRDPQRVHVGEALDFWRVEEIEPGHLLRLRAEMKLPGEAWLELRSMVDSEGTTTYSQRASFLPRGLPGQLYWWSVSPFHAAVFGGMLRNIVRKAEDEWAARAVATA
ncbi:SDR family oxidoreductase [Frankia sp. B2]|uniref:SDR family oxidoreductase n=1 Tax=unclassified Frankia TaxID=2632575 RepID=UPI0003CFF9FD|nr:MULTISPECIES: SDR family oxidoreductase [unclassified Frankia]ETA03111.1 putative nucleoside-diphosphate sugar epimerase [Frankia sp. CcI6]KDA42960.1 putative nucleoside-diphosphate sugar epimerase [Frankia sp. BMG5.23]KFB06095.1 putative nucleoside-diphosphate sugar epimerase [Frankia sp. Allo2]OHV53990.1 NAD(P)-dependent oxidoreductase [Frankia sp. CgIS1]TFE34407.1 SDR family oxidoreductase [Frankia sp. B2]